ncbi:hypothetical protein ACF3NR_09960 [Vaginella massiliensis]|uniref:hypothetical protein n=1 Tax=Vaginella massiliensis TaxID=1816680 RepID=UPI000838B9F3|nr:hypothetical protein [Vaginella massiliensis]
MKKKINYTPGQPIRNLDELRAAKRHLQREMKRRETAHDNSLLGKTMGFIENVTTDDTYASNGIERSLNFLSDKISTRYPLGGLSKVILSGLVIIAVPIITSKLQNFIQDRLFR